MKLLIVGSDKIYAIENAYEKYIREAGAEVSIFTAQNYFYDYYNHSILNKLLYRAHASGILHKINALFREAVNRFQPDAVWIFKGMEMLPSTLQWLRKQGIKLINYNPDNPFIFSGKGSGNQNITRSISLYDLHFTYNLKIKQRLEERYHAKTFFLPFGFDLGDDLYSECARQEEIVKSCFAGNPDKERAAFIEALADKGIPVDVYGNHWKQFIKHPLISLFPPVLGNEFWKTLRRYRVQLNLMRPHNEDSHNMRTFEVPAVGGILVAPDTPEHRLFFEDGEEIFLFSGIQQCSEQVKYILGLSKDHADQIRERARQRSLSSGYSYRDRARVALAEIKRLYA